MSELTSKIIRYLTFRLHSCIFVNRLWCCITIQTPALFENFQCYQFLKIYTGELLQHCKATQEDEKCFNCGEEYIETILYGCIKSEYSTDNDNKVVERLVGSEQDCKLCGKSLSLTYKAFHFLALCSDCYLVFSEWIESTLVKKRILILYLPWCREYSNIDDFLFNNVLHGNFELADTVNIAKDFDVKEMTKGGYGIIHKATWLSNNETVILERFENSINGSNHFLNELKSYQRCFDESLRAHIIKIYGFTRDPESEDYILVIKYASEGLTKEL
ncbi:kinase-like domain-containing protein [Rhizophagus irregularis DAOM 181602=DAOM 197198]|nr:kinase-like domain-containing protein [Rhizophagus irregularis DAOM 181602=DAOM 197198]